MHYIKVLELKVAVESRLIQVSNYYYFIIIIIIIIIITIIIIIIIIIILLLLLLYYHYKRSDVDKFCLYRFTTVARKYHEKACKRSAMRKKQVVMISVGHRRKKIQVKLVKIGSLIDNIIIVIIIIITIINCFRRTPS